MLSLLMICLAPLLVVFHLGLVPRPQPAALLVRPARQAIKAIYLTAHTAGSKSRRQELVRLVETTELNAMVIDLKDYSGKVFFRSGVRLAEITGAQDLTVVPDLAAFVDDLKRRGIYAIARVAVFQDPHLAEARPDLALHKKSGEGLWRDHKGLAWVDTSKQEVWDYNLDLMAAAAQLGYDEINLDYIRFASDGNLRDIRAAGYEDGVSKTAIMRDFFAYAGQRFTHLPVRTSVDLFGLTLWQDNGLGIGQRFEDAAPHFDYIAPMVYPSHYAVGFEGFSNPADHPYEVVGRSLARGQRGLEGTSAEFRPWLQDFDLGADYTPEMVRAQIQAAYDEGSRGWMLWNASNRYTESALLAEDATSTVSTQ